MAVRPPKPSAPPKALSHRKTKQLKKYMRDLERYRKALPTAQGPERTRYLIQIRAARKGIALLKARAERFARVRSDRMARRKPPRRRKGLMVQEELPLPII